MQSHQRSVIFKKNLSHKDSEIVFDSIAQNQLHDSNRQGAWIQIKGLLKFVSDSEEIKPTVLTDLFKGVLIDLVVYTGQPEFIRKDGFQTMSLSKDGDKISAMIFAKAESSSNLMGILSSMHQQKELSLWARLDIEEHQLADFTHLNIPIEHLTLTFS
ncbi:hypothetical protein ICN49_11050 [Polynucleobacter sp. MWH-Mekk-B1]|uniref:hypothetical protein n=1 Tax=Polynucleobacter finlandensis TaxID=1855894 RepID=UPI001C0B54F4|nr:hypothetical protein [Polynucleobacter finlandensis]MBU3545458.1 hypothetical protein [Polynucleobacter finlandensis]